MVMAVKENGSTNRERVRNALPLHSLNHISRKCSNLKESENFYENVLGFVQIKRPDFGFDGAWLFNYGIGIHLLQCDSGKVVPEREIDPRSDHISFQCEDIGMVEATLELNDIKYVRREVEEGGILVDQLFFHDPDGFMIEVCNCDQLPVVPLAAITNQQQFHASCKRRNPMSTVIPLSMPDCVSQNIIQGSNHQIGHDDYARCG